MVELTDHSETQYHSNVDGLGCWASNVTATILATIVRATAHLWMKGKPDRNGTTSNSTSLVMTERLIRRRTKESSFNLLDKLCVPSDVPRECCQNCREYNARSFGPQETGVTIFVICNKLPTKALALSQPDCVQLKVKYSNQSVRICYRHNPERFVANQTASGVYNAARAAWIRGDPNT